MDIYFATSNAIKLKIANEILNKYGIKIKQIKVNLNEIQSLNIKEVALYKAAEATKSIKKPLIVSDDGFYIKALGGFPGALLKPVREKLDEEKILKLMEWERNRKATFENVIVFATPDSKDFKVFTTVLNGGLAMTPKGNRHVGWSIERIFVPEGYKKSIAEFNDQEWDRFWNRYKKRLHYTKLGKWLNKRG